MDNHAYHRRQRSQLFLVVAFAPKIDAADINTVITKDLIDPDDDFLACMEIDADLVRHGPKGAKSAFAEFLKRHGKRGDLDSEV